MDINHIVDSPFRALPRGDQDAPALSIDGTEWWSYADLRDRRDRYIKVLLDAGVTPADRVGMILVNCLDYVALYFAIARIGAIAVRLNFRLAPAELSFLVEDSGSTVVFFHSSRTQQLEPIHEDLSVRSWFCLRDDETAVPEWAQAPDLDSPADGIDDLPRPSGADPVMIMYTSGTTGRPKGAVWTHDNAMWFATIQAMQWGFTRRTVTMTTGPLYHAGAFECFTLPALMVYGRAVIMSSGGMSAQRIADTIAAAQVSDALLYPFLIYDLLALGPDRLRTLGSLKLVMSGGDPLQAWAIEALTEHLPNVELNKGFGLTEGGGQSAVLTQEFSRSHADTVGRPLPLTEIRVVGIDGSDTAPDEVGEIWVRSPAVSGVYWNRPEATKETFVDGWCRTGDLGRVTSDGFLLVSGRSKDMIRSGGENIYPAEIEGVLARHPDVGAVAVVAVPDSKYLEVGCAVVVPADDDKPQDELESALREWAATHLARYKCPRHYVFVDELPVSPSGKVLKRVLRDTYASAQVAAEAATP
ncbi:long-chain fatty acid--CoA ligase [Rhodococcus sp. 14C212]|uniref:class I adenylate-forming enzyme family protein n=1 Tax=Rhodococcus sp. 14C212 TaxID=2711209 RepID=UPI0013ECFCE2|nr:AMP-binding protein [Rhodococcus sp. 14C212]NGP07755.1 long-chain fatty acid--CoA ligase [Rhodococcus sp. 14C212]